MAAFAAADVTVAITDQYISGGRRHVTGTIAFGDGALTYATGGVPLPAIAAFGMPRSLKSLNIWGGNGLTTDYVTRYNPATHKLLLYEEEATAAGGPLLEADTSEAPAARVYYFTAVGD